MTSVSHGSNRLKPDRRTTRAFIRRNVIPWVLAGLFALSAAWLGARYMTVRFELALLRDQNALLDVALKTAEQQLEAERIITRRLLEDAPTRFTDPKPDGGVPAPANREAR